MNILLKLPDDYIDEDCLKALMLFNDIKKYVSSYFS